MRRVLVTGGAGFVGSHLVARLVDLGHAVRVVDDLSTGRRDNLAGVLDRVEFVEADLVDQAACRDAVRRVDIVFHAAAVPSVPRSLAEPLRTHQANVDATVQLLEACRAEGGRRVVYAASASAYGDGDEQPKTETLVPRPRSLYAVHKHVGELYGRLYTELFGVEVVSLRYFNIYGPRQDPDGAYAAVIPKFITRMLKGERPIVYGDGGASRDFVYVDDVVEANLLAMTTTQAAGRCMNIGSGRSVSLNELVAQLNVLLGTHLPPLHEAERAGDVRHSRADVRLAAELLGFTARIDLREGLSRTLDSFR